MDLVVRNARIWTADPARPWATALAASGGRITAVGEDHDVATPPGVTTIDAAGQFLMPGIVDSHNHVRLGSGDGAVQLGGATTLAEVHARIDAWLDENPDAPSALRRVISENRDAVTRALKAQARDNG